MVNKGWLYGLMVFLAQTCNPYYSANTNQYEQEEEIVFEDNAISPVEIPDEAFDLSENIQVEPPRRVEEAPPPPPPPPMPEEEPVFKIVENMPRFPGCEQKAVGSADLKKCSEKEMMNFVAKNLKYPKIAMENGIKGKVIIRFVVDKRGNVRDAVIVRDIGGGCGREALRIVNSMPQWIPGKQRGRPVNVQYNLPVSFALVESSAPEVEEVAPPPPPAPEKERIFRVVEEMPRFQGCEGKGLSKSDLKVCSDKELLKFIYSNLKYPELARENGVEGRVIMSFVVKADGTLSDIKVLREPGAGCGMEATRVVKMMPKWIPGKTRGKGVSVKFNLPVSFKLDKNPKKN